MGLDGFALNLGDPTASWSTATVSAMFLYVQNNYAGKFYLFISMDVWASGDADVNGQIVNEGPAYFTPTIIDYIGSGVYFKDTPNGHPLVSTFSSGGFDWGQWNTWLDSIPEETPIYFMPVHVLDNFLKLQYLLKDKFYADTIGTKDFDDTDGYYSSDGGWWYYWGNITQGLFSWESAWPPVNAVTDGSISKDQPVMDACVTQGQAYMIPLSLTQYKNSYGANVYRQGETQLGQRMINILASTTSSLEFVQILTWNDGPEGHYIGNLWPEQNSDQAPNQYANMQYWDHSGLQIVLAPFITAFKNHKDASSVSPGGDASAGNAVGVLMYHAQSTEAECPYFNLGVFSYYALPYGYEDALNNLEWIVILGPDGADYSIWIWSGDKWVYNTAGVPGLQSGQWGPMNPGCQMMEIRTSSGIAIYSTSAADGTCFWGDDCPQGFYNLNTQVLILNPGGSTPCSCTNKMEPVHFLPINSTYDDIMECEPLVVDPGDQNSSNVWYTSQAGLALEFEALHNLKYLGKNSDTIPNLDSYVSSYFETYTSTGCAEITDGTACSIPTGSINCPASGNNTKTPYLFIQRAYSTYHNCLVNIQGKAVLGSIQSLSIIDSLVSDVTNYLTPKNDNADVDKILAVIAGGLAIASGFFEGGGAAYVIEAAGTAVLGGIFSILSTTVPDDPTTQSSFISNPGPALGLRVNATITAIESALSGAAAAVFTSGDLSSFPAAALDPKGDPYAEFYTTNIPKFFANGKFSNINMDCGTLFGQHLSTIMQQSLFGYMLSSANAYILQNAYTTDGCTGASSALVEYNGTTLCYSLEFPGQGVTSGDTDPESLAWSIPVDGALITSMTDSYGINFSQFIMSSIACQQARGYNGAVDYELALSNYGQYSSTNYPPCLFNLPVITVEPGGGASSTPCYVYGNTSAAGVGNYLPDYLQSAFGICNTICLLRSCVGGG